MTSPDFTAMSRLRILALAAALFSVLAGAGAAAAQTAEPPPVSCITDNPVDPLGPGYLLERGRFTTTTPTRGWKRNPSGTTTRGRSWADMTHPASSSAGFSSTGGGTRRSTSPEPRDRSQHGSTPAARSWATTRTRAAGATASCTRRAASGRSTCRANRPRPWASTIAAKSSAEPSTPIPSPVTGPAAARASDSVRTSWQMWGARWG